MKLRKKANMIFRYFIATCMIFLIMPICEKAKVSISKNHDESFANMDIECLINVKDEWNCKKGMQAGYAYELLKRYSNDASINSEIEFGDKGANYLDSLREGNIDILVTHLPKGGKTEGIEYSKTLKDSIVLAVSEKNAPKLREINRWLTQFTGQEGYKFIECRYFTNYTPWTRLSSGKRYKLLSPYDNIIKSNARRLGWDWRLLTAVIYQESRFSIDASSHRGAGGLMQIMPTTAERFNLLNPEDPSDNIKIGTAYLARLRRMFAKYAADEENLTKFTLAAYNAGEGRLLDCIHYAQEIGKPHSTWDDILNVIPEMRKDSVMDSDTVKFGKFQGHETIAYISKIMDLYDVFREISTSPSSGRIGRVNTSNK